MNNISFGPKMKVYNSAIRSILLRGSGVGAYKEYEEIEKLFRSKKHLGSQAILNYIYT